MLIFEYFCKNSFGTCWHARVIDRSITSVLDAHSSSVNGVELVFHAGASRGALAACGSWIVATLRYGRPLDIKLGRLSGYQILCLITTWLDHQTLVHVRVLVLLVSTDRARIKRLPRILLVSSWSLSWRLNLIHSVNHGLIELILVVASVLSSTTGDQVLLPLGVLLGYQSHWQLPDVDRMIGVVLTSLTTG